VGVSRIGTNGRKERALSGDEDGAGPQGPTVFDPPWPRTPRKLIRQLSLISYLMAERRPVTATEIRRDVEGYSGMNEDAFARRF
jgi:hypothetical protein